MGCSMLTGLAAVLGVSTLLYIAGKELQRIAPSWFHTSFVSLATDGALAWPVSSRLSVCAALHAEYHAVLVLPITSINAKIGRMEGRQVPASNQVLLNSSKNPPHCCRQLLVYLTHDWPHSRSSRLPTPTRPKAAQTKLSSRFKYTSKHSGNAGHIRTQRLATQRWQAIWGSNTRQW